MANHHFLLLFFCTTVLQTVINSQHLCNFDIDLCNWDNHKSIDITWKRKEGKSYRKDAEILANHTTRSGSYLHLEYQNLTEKNVAQILTPAFLQTNTSYCLSFYYSMSGNFDKVLYVYRYSNDTQLNDQEPFVLDGSQDENWRLFQASFKTETENRLMFEAHLEGHSTDISIDDVQLSEGSCLDYNMISNYESLNNNPEAPPQLPFTCDFEQSGICGFTMSGYIKWKRNHGRRSYINHGPIDDHTTRTKNGYYLYVFPYRSAKAVGNLISPVFSGKDQICLQFWYNMYGKDINKLDVNIRNKTVWYAAGDQGFGWKVAYVSILPGEDFKITFSAWNSHNIDGYIAVDDVRLQQGKCSRPDICTFEGPMCSWANTKYDSLDWVETKGSENRRNGPSTDHSHGTTEGTYLFLDAKKSKTEDTRALLSSESFSMRVKARCLHFWYHMKGNVGQLTVFKETENKDEKANKKELLWSLVGDQGSIWNYASVEILPQPENFYLVFEGILGLNNTRGIAIDDFAINSIQCKTSPQKANLQKPVVKTTKKSVTLSHVTIEPGKIVLKCHFLKDTCNWGQGRDDTSDWILTKSKHFGGQGPIGDHTSADGFYMNLPSNASQTAHLYSPFITPTAGHPMCLSFWYYMYGPNIESFKVYISKNNLKEKTPHWVRLGTQGNQWIQGKLLILQTQIFKITFEAKVKQSSFGNIALDDILLVHGTCNSLTTMKPDVSVPLAQRKCNFEANDICGFSVKSSSNFNWSRHSGSTDTLGTGPTNDHTLESSSGHYMYVSATKGNLTATSSLMSPFYRNSDSVCLQFYYHMYGDGIGTLNIYIKVGNSTSRIHQISGNQGNKWQVDTATIDIAKTSKNLYRVIFEAVKGPNKRGDIAIDDISFTLGSCSMKGDCDFEDSNCLWTNVQNTGDNFDWIKMRGPVSTKNTGLKFDHTKQNSQGHYQYIGSSKGNNPGRAWLVSPLFQPLTSDTCLRFWYTMNGKDSRLSVIVTVAGSSKITIWQLEGNQKTAWLQGQVSLPRINKPYSVVFEGTNGKEQSSIALDDITFTNEGCKILPIKAYVKHIMTTHKPDLTKSPPVSSSCAFTSGFCGWNQDKTDDGNWQTGLSKSGPKTDHTGDGHYIFVQHSSQPNKKFRLISPDFQPNSNTSCVTFWYNKQGYSSYYLRMYIKEGLNLPSSPVLALNEYSTNKWEQEMYNVHITKKFNVVFEAEGNSFGVTSIDDVSITHGACKNDFSQSLFCNFENNNICDFKQELHAKKTWIRHQGSTSTKNTGPFSDHTYRSNKGHYMFVEGSNTKPNSKVKLFSPVIKLNDSSSCVQFYFNMRGNVGMLSVYVLDGKRSSFLWNRFGHQNSNWQLTSMQITAHKQYQIYFQAIVGGKYDGDIAIDDFNVQSGQCKKQGTCNFENGICDWEMSDENDFDWFIQKANVQSKLLGPLTDHTRVKGHYLLAKSNSGQAGSVSKLISTDFDPSTVNCLHLWYNIYGQTPATMTVYKQASNTSILWQLRDEHEGNWKEARVPISNTSEVFSIVIEVKSDKSNYVAIDDTHFDKMHDCTRKPSSAIPSNAKRFTTKPATVPQKDSFKSCSFSQGFCSWVQITGSKLKWQLNRGKTNTKDTGPIKDHTNGYGRYIYIETSNPVASGDTAHLISPEFQVPVQQEWCLSFWYHMYGAGIGTLSVVYRGKSDTVAWQKRKSQGNKWLNAKVNIKGPQSLKIVFQATKGKSFDGDIALDDILITQKQCPEPTTSLSPYCDFESTCSLFQSVKSALNWQLTTVTKRPNYKDHTYKSSLGDYIYVDISNADPYSGAQFNIPKIRNRTVCLEFFYRALGNFTGRLTVFNTKKGQKVPLLKLQSEAVPNEWTFAELEVQSYEEFQLSFYVLSGSNPKGGIAVDDIDMKYDHCNPLASCDFEKEHLCHWKNSPNNRHDWIIHSGGTDSWKTGPTTDHSTGTKTGSYIYIEASNLHKNEKVRLVSELLTNNGFTSCLSFWYSMYGDGIDELNMYIQDSEHKETLMWTLKGNQGKSWQNGRIPLITSSNEYRVIIEGSANSFRGDIAIDEIYNSPHSCSFFPSRAQVYFKSTTQSPTTVKNKIDTETDVICTFENNQPCSWTQSQLDNFQWTLQEGYTPAKSIGPQGDHTTGSGHYLYLNTEGQSINSRAQLYLVYTPQENRTKCLQFWYNMRGQHVDYLNVYVQYGTSSGSPTWSKRSDQGPNWHVAQIDFQELNKVDMKLIIEGVKGGNSLGNIAIDDISIISDSCHESYGQCDFETRSLCGYEPDINATFKWKWRTGYSPVFSTGPNKDHTYGTSKGHYMYISSRRPRKPNDVAQLLSPKYDPPNKDQCVQFYYNIYGQNVGSLNIKLRIHAAKPYDTGSYLQIKGDQQKGWILGMVEIPKMIENKFQVIFEGVIGKGQYGDIAIDDIEIKPGECEVGGDCDFDHGRCTWQNMNNNIFNWLLSSGSTVTSNTGPVSDHTFQNEKGFYLFIDATYLKKEDKSRYISQTFPPLYSEKRCIHFWYSMNGNGVGILKILTMFDTGTNVTIWELSRDQGNQWMFGQAPIESYTSYRIIIEATRGRTFEGDIAIDDISFKESDCSVLPHTAAPQDTNVVIPTGTPPTHTDITKPFNCSFDKGLCGWSQDQQDDFDWTEMSGKTQSWGTGPSSDHGGKGHYLYIDASNQRYGQKARLISPLVKSVGMLCVSIYYYMYGSDINNLKMYIVAGSNTPQQIFTKTGSQGRHWTQVQIQFQTLSPVNVILEATRGRGNQGDIAIDDVAYREGHCTIQSSIGNGIYYTFENSLRLIQQKNDDFDWVLGSGRSSFFSSRPSKDHTYHSSRGHYMYLKGNARLHMDNKAIMSTKDFYSTKSDICVKFWYYIYGKAAGSLRVQYLSGTDNFKSPKSVWMRNDNEGNQWNEANINIKNHSAQHIRIEFVGIVGPGYSLNVAIDDVFLTNKPCAIKPDFCHFEKDKCDWQNKKTADFDWVIGSGKYTSLYGPSKDHTLQTTAGSYLYLEPAQRNKYDNSQSNQIAVLESQQFQPSNQKKCLEFYYYINKARNSSLQVSLYENGDENLIWHLSSDQGPNWTKGQTHLSSTANPFRVRIKGIRGLNYAGDIALDDIKFTTTSPCKTLPSQASPDVSPTTTTTANPLIKVSGFNCNFDKNSCGWRNRQGAGIAWKRTKGSTENPNTGPSADHTGGGFYVYIESSFISHYADLMSPTFSTTQQACISFYYHMFGAHINSLQLIMVTKTSSQIIWLKSGPQSNKWLHGSVTIPAVISTYILFRGKSGLGNMGDIAIDDVTISTGQCQENISSNSVDCDFEAFGSCQYFQDKNVDFKWVKYSGRFAPYKDHTKRSVFGSFMGAGSSSISSGKVSRLWTPGFETKDGLCLSFWYHMSGRRIGTLDVHATSVNDVNRMGAAIWSRRGYQGPTWLEEYIPLPNFSTAYVIFESINGGNIIGIDDVKLLKSCPEPGDCHFEISSCGWNNNENNTINWERVSGRTIYHREHRVIYDHTYNRSSSYMMYIGVSQSKTETKGDLVSISFDKTSDTGLCIKFWFIINGDNMGKLSVILQTASQSTVMWQLSDSQGSEWLQGTFYVKSDSAFTLSLRAEIEENAKGYIAIDDINYNAQKCVVTPLKARPSNQPSTTRSLVTMVSTPSTSVLPPGPYDCTFESNNYCGWTQTKSTVNWIISTGSRYGFNPFVDHTTGKSSGHFALFQYSIRNPSVSTVKLLSPEIHNYTLSCLSFWFHMYGNRMRSLSVQHMSNNKVFMQVWYHSQPLSRGWHPASVTLSLNENEKIAFQIDNRGYLSGSIALDDIKLTPGHCTIKTSCGFEDENLCEFLQQKTYGNFYWKVRDEKAPATDTQILPRYDHTANSLTGHYMYLRPSRSLRISSQLYSNVHTKTSGSCVSFWYSIGGTRDSMRLSVNSLIANKQQNLWNRSSRTGKGWNQAEVTVKSTTTHWQIAFTGYFASYDQKSYIAIDDVKVTSGSCPMDGDCNFEKDMCTWSNSEQDNFDWLQTTAANNGFGPKFDHSQQNEQGSYIYILPKWPTQVGEKAVLVSDPIAPNPQRRCMSFWYYMKGISIGELEVGYENESVLWSLPGKQTNQWQLGQVPLNVTNKYKKMTISASYGTGSQTLIAIDEISFNLKSCGLYPFNAKPIPKTTVAHTTPTTPPTTFKPNSKFDCSFENGLCSWIQSHADIFDWKLQHGPTRSTGTGPNADHTYGTNKGYYIYIETSSPRRKGDTAILTSSSFSQNSNYTLEFYYHMYGSTIGRLNVTMTLDGQQKSQLLWTQRRSHNRVWLKAEISLLPQKVPFTISFVGIVGSSVFGDIAIDDIRVFTTEQTEAPLNCTFETIEICNFTIPSNGELQWKRHTGITRYPSNGPNMDHTFGTPYGHYMVFENLLRKNNNSTALLMSPSLNSSADICMSFYYYMHGYRRASLNVYQQINKQNSASLWSDTTDQGSRWVKAQVSLRANQGYKVIFEGVLHSYGAYVAVDDISSKSGECPDPGNNDFEDDMGTWANMKKNDVYWIRASGEMQYQLPHPAIDHTLQTVKGHYIFLASYSNSVQKGILRSQVFPATNLRCLHFWFYLDGTSPGGIKIYFVDEETEDKTAIWALSTQQGNSWNYAQTGFRWQKPFYVEFEGITNMNHDVYTAIDDIEFTNDYCAVQPLQAKTKYKFVPDVTTTLAPVLTKSALDCTFENDFCKWTQAKTSDFFWQRKNGPTKSLGTGPQTDHTYGNATGYYVYIETSYPRKPNDTANLISPKIPSTANGCFRFWYHMFGPDVDTLTVYNVIDNARSPLWRKQGTVDEFWHQAIIEIHFDKENQLVLEGRRGKSPLGDISIDDISFSNKQCPSSSDRFCDFESTDICGFTQSTKDKFDWVRGQGASYSRNSGPSSDHTFGTWQGHYMYIKSVTHNLGDNAILISPTYKSTAEKCVNFWYHMYGSQIGRLNVYLRTSVSKQLLWTRYHGQGNFWSLAQVKISVSGTFHLEFEAITDKGSQGNIAIDDFSLSEGQCPKAGNVDFEKGLSTWMNVVDDDFDWIIGTGQKFYYFNGPKIDHTLGTFYGHYLLLRALSPFKSGDHALLASEYLDGSMHKCMTFWYYMYGQGVGTLRFVIVQLGSNITSWSLTGNQGSYWRYGHFPISSNKPFQIIIDGIRGVSNRVNFVIDDIEFNNKKCSLYPKTAVEIPVSTTSQSPVTTVQPKTTPIPTKYDCDFEQNMCSWSNDAKADYKWTRAQGPKGNFRSGPTVDHTSGKKDGWYLLSKSSWLNKPNSKARIIGPSIPGTQTRCLNFWYHMFGAYVNQLQVNVTEGTNTRSLWMKVGDQGNLWRQAFIHLDKGAFKTNYKITFETVRGSHSWDYIALDDIRFTLGACHENNPTFCDFESENKCNYTHNKNADFEWTWHHGRTQSTQTGPNADHTMGTSSGHYFYIETSFKKENQTAQLVSPKYHTDSPTCLHFFYYMYGADVNTLNVYQMFGNQFDELKTPIWNMENSQGANWNEATVTLSAHSNYSIVFEGISGKGFRGDIAIDDVYQSNGSCQTPGFCEFENGLCNWKNDKFDDFDWIIGQGPTLTDDTGPIYDHTLKNAEGHYMYIDSSNPVRPGDVANLLSEHFPGTKKPTCLKFWYQMYGKDVNALNVLVRKSFGIFRHYDAAYLWRLSGNNGQQWLKAQVYVDPKYTAMSHQFIFEAIRGNGSFGDIAVDDISISPKSCAVKPTFADPHKLEFQEVSCDFKLNFCQWQFDPKSDFNWTLTGYYKRIESHTGSGSYIYIKNYPQKTGSKSLMHTPPLGPTSNGGNCLSFWYYMYGSNIGTLNVYMTKFGRKMLVWTKRGSQESQWNYAHLNVTNDYNYMLYIEFVTNGRTTGMVALDDIFMDTNGCPHPRSCDFEVNTCGWTVQHTLKNMWRISTYLSQISDHTTGTKSGHYMYSSSYRYGRKQTITARLTSPPFPPASKSCLKFWYNMHVQNSSRLQLYIQIGLLKRKVWERIGDQGKGWWQGHANIEIPLQKLGMTYQLTFQSMQLNGHSEIIALDDIEHLPGPCAPKGLCDFEQGLCGFTNIYGDDFDWVVLSGSKQNFVTGPTEDHTTNSPSGHYMYMDTRWFRHENDRAWLSSWENEPTNATCVSFWYHMYGNGMGDLNVIYRNKEKNRTVWHESGNQGNIWLLGNFTIISSSSYVIIFEGIRGKTYTSDIALDDVRFQMGYCESLPSIPTTTVAPVKQEVYYQCNFEFGLCGWQLDSSTDAQFMISYGIFTYKRGGPTSDHTQNNRFGHYLLLNNSQSTSNRTARFISPDLHMTKPICITFWYFMRVSNFGAINVYVHNDGEKKEPLWTRVGTQGIHWLYATIDVTNPEKANKIYFEAIRNSGPYGIAFDDIKVLIGSCPEINECHFEEKDVCGFEQGTTDKFNWTRGNHFTAGSKGPITDHTYKSFYGHFMYLNMQEQEKDDHAHLYTPQYPATQTERCLSFWYYMYGTFNDKINVYMYQNNKITSKLWSVQTNQGPHWRLATVSVNSQTPFQILFEGIRGYSSYVIIALDDVKISQTACEPLASCSFEDGFCGWFNNRLTISHSLNWVIKTGHYRRTRLEPKIDHTTGDIAGSYIHIYSNQANARKTSYLESQMIPNKEASHFCFHFWYYMYGTDTGSLIIYVHYHGRSLKAIWTKDGSVSNQWNEEYVSVINPYIDFEMVIGSISGTNGSIAVDDVMLMKGECPNMKGDEFVCKSGLKIPSEKVCDFIFDCPDDDDEDNCGSCTFEDDMCTWKDYSHGSFEWVRGRNGDTFNETGPAKDHTWGNSQGWYAYLESSNGTRTRYANLENRVIQQTSSTCQLNFWFYIPLKSYGSLLSLEISESNIATSLITYRSRSNAWQEATVAIGKVSRPFRLMFYGTRSFSAIGTVAIDDITLTDCNFPRPKANCEKYEFQCKNKACIDSSQICDLSNDCGDGSDESSCDDFNSCDFDFGFCDWSQDWNDDFDWTRTNGETLSYSTGPKRDHSTGTGTGYYIYTEASSPRKKGDKARLYSPIIKSTAGSDCWIRFFYHMSGYRMGTLNVYTRTSVLGKYKKIWTKTGHVADYWERADVQLNSTQKFQVLFESIIGGYSSDIALDDITFLPGCEIIETDEKLPNGTIPKPTPTPCPIGLYPCRDRSGCIQYSNVCDFEKNCGDNSDEDVCGDCNFESNLCGWTDYSHGKYKWASHQGDLLGKIGPSADHTTKSIKGKYMRVFRSSGIYRTPAVMSTRPYGETGKNCRIEFYTFLSGPDIGTLNLNTIDLATGKILKTLYRLKTGTRRKWVEHSVHIGALKPGFSLQFEALPETQSSTLTMDTDIAIDDIKLIECDPAPIRIYTTPKTTWKNKITTGHSTPTTTPGKHKTPTTTPGKQNTPKMSSSSKSSSKKPFITTHKNQHVSGKPVHSTARVTTTQTPIVCGFTKFGCQTEQGFDCLPTAYHCDGKKDCLNGEDESSCMSCPKNYTYCKPQRKCIKEIRCNGSSECNDGSDESLCTECRADLCQESGVCYLREGIPVCSCGNVTEQINHRCIISRTESFTATRTHKKTWAIPVGIILALIMVGALVFGIYFFWKKRMRRNYSPSVTAGIDNPMYNYDFKMAEFEPPSFSNTETQGDSTAIENPLYSDLK